MKITENKTLRSEQNRTEQNRSELLFQIKLFRLMRSIQQSEHGNRNWYALLYSVHTFFPFRRESEKTTQKIYTQRNCAYSACASDLFTLCVFVQSSFQRPHVQQSKTNVQKETQTKFNSTKTVECIKIQVASTIRKGIFFLVSSLIYSVWNFRYAASALAKRQTENQIET